MLLLCGVDYSLDYTLCPTQLPSKCCLFAPQWSSRVAKRLRARSSNAAAMLPPTPSLARTRSQDQLQALPLPPEPPLQAPGTRQDAAP